MTMDRVRRTNKPHIMYVEGAWVVMLPNGRAHLACLIWPDWMPGLIGVVDR